METDLTAQFHDQMLEVYFRAGKEIKYWASRFKQKVVRVGGLKAAQDWLLPNKKQSDGLGRVAELNRLDLSFEYLVLQDPWASLFTEVELQVARKRLISSIDLPTPPLVIDFLTEGTRFQIKLTAYERNPKARQLCIDHYGAACGVCGFDFEKTFGEIGKGYIHVHHLKPLSAIGETYIVDPIVDLLPVCPNCHAMLHRENPPISIDRLKTILKVTA